MKKGITTIMLIITVTVMAILLTTMVNVFLQGGLVNDANTTLNNYKKDTVINQINTHIKEERLKKEIAGLEGELTQEELINILSQYGQYDESKLELTIPDNSIKIYLYEILDIPVGQYVTFSYSNNVLALESQLIELGYEIEYSIDNGINWNKYTEEFEVANINTVSVRVLNNEGYVVSVHEGLNKDIICSITSDVTNSVTNLSKITYTFTFDKNVVGFTIEDINVENGEKEFLSGSGNVYTLLVKNVKSGTQVVSISEGCCSDTMGRYNNAASISTIIDIAGPSIETNVISQSTKFNKVSLTFEDTADLSGYAITTSNTEPSIWYNFPNINLNDIELKLEYGAIWAKIFSHTPNGGTTLFANEAEAKSCNTTGKYSILGRLEEFRNTSNSFEFLLQYPNESNGYNRWIQSSNPTTTSESVTGYIAKSIAWSGNSWGGLAKSNSTGTFIDGSVGISDWYYAIGCYSKWSTSIPGYNAVPTSLTELWVRVDDCPQATTSSNTVTIQLDNSNTVYYIWSKDILGNVSSKMLNM